MVKQKSGHDSVVNQNNYNSSSEIKIPDLVVKEENQSSVIPGILTDSLNII